MKKRFLSALFALCMALTLSPVSAMAGELDYVAQIGETSYTSLQDAIDASADNDTITLLKDTAENIEIDETFTHPITIDLNNFTLRGTGGLAIEYKGTGTLTITDNRII